MVTELSRIEYVKIQFIKIFRKTIRSFLNGNEIKPVFYLIDRPIHEANLADMIRLDIATETRINLLRPTRFEFHCELMRAIKEIPSLDGFRIDFLVSDDLTETHYGPMVELSQIVVVNEESGLVLMRYYPDEYLKVLRHLEGDLSEQNNHLLNALKFLPTNN